MMIKHVGMFSIYETDASIQVADRRTSISIAKMYHKYPKDMPVTQGLLYFSRAQRLGRFLLMAGCLTTLPIRLKCVRLVIVWHAAPQRDMPHSKTRVQVAVRQRLLVFCIL